MYEIFMTLRVLYHEIEQFDWFGSSFSLEIGAKFRILDGETNQIALFRDTVLAESRIFHTLLNSP